MLAELLEATEQEGPWRLKSCGGAAVKYFERLHESRQRRRGSDGSVRHEYEPSEQLVREHTAQRVPRV